MITQTPAWLTLRDHHKTLQNIHLRSLFDADPKRGSRFHLSLPQLSCDYSRQRITDQTLKLLIELAKQQDLAPQIQDLFCGARVNRTENRAALHTALRNLKNTPVYLEERNIMEDITGSLEQMKQFCHELHGKRLRGSNQEPITDVINIGIGGSDLGPKLVCDALQANALPNIRCHFVSNIDPAPLEQLLNTLNPATTIVLIASKSFGTQETLLNATIIKQWLKADKQLYAITSNAKKAHAFGIQPDHIFKLWSFVGGRYSVWSAIGLTIAIQFGFDQFIAFLKGASDLDDHFSNTPFEKNLPVLLGLIGIWNTNFFNIHHHAVLPYAHALRYFIPYLQQLEMESNGKSINHLGETIDYQTAPIIWGGVGCNSQHAFHQLCHQGPQLICADFITVEQPSTHYEEHAKRLQLNARNQAEALAFGKTRDEVIQELRARNLDQNIPQMLAPHKTIPGNRPTTLLTLKGLTPQTLGTLLALFEHKVYVQSVIWEINPFDQWGIELGKQLDQQSQVPGAVNA